MPTDLDYATLQTDMHKCGAERIPFGGEGSSSIPSPVKKIKFETRVQVQEQSAQCASYVTPILHRPALRNPFSGEVLNSIPLPVKQIQVPQSKHVANDDEVTTFFSRFCVRSLEYS